MLFRPRRWVTLFAALLFGCGGGGSTKPPESDGGTPPGPGDAAVLPPYRLPGRIVVEPTALLFTKPGEQGQLRARVFDADGKPVTRVVTWESSQSAAVTVDDDGRVSSVAPLGSALIRARAGEIISEPVLVLIAEPPPGAVLVSDAQIVGDPAAVAGDKPTTPAQARWRVQLVGIPEPMVGTMVLAREGKAVAGRVVSSTAKDGGYEVILQGVPLLELFRRLDVNAVFRIDERAVALSKLGPPPPSPAPALRARRPGDDQTGWPRTGDWGRHDSELKLGPFECEVSASAQLFSGSLAPQIVPGLNFTLRLLKDADDHWSEVTVKAEGTIPPTRQSWAARPRWAWGGEGRPSPSRRCGS